MASVIGDTGGENPLRRLWNLLDAQAWDALEDVLDPAMSVTYVHTGEVFDRAAYVEVNRTYPGRWTCRTDELVVAGDRAVARVRVTGGDETYWVASFATVQDGRIVELTEVWTTAVAPPPADRRPG